MSHFWQRCRERLVCMAKMSHAEARTLTERCKCIARQNKGSVAVYLAHTDDFMGNYYDNYSNGRNIVAIIRNGHFVTAMFRRDEQPATAEALRVDRVIFERREKWTQ